MQTDNAFYCSAQMLKFKNNFTKPLSLKIISKDIYSVHCFIFSKSQTFICFYKILCVPHGSDKHTKIY